MWFFGGARTRLARQGGCLCFRTISSCSDSPMQIRTNTTLLRDVKLLILILAYNAQSVFVKVVRAKQLVHFYCLVIHCKSNKILISNSFSCSGSFTAKATLRPLLNFGANDCDQPTSSSHPSPLLWRHAKVLCRGQLRKRGKVFERRVRFHLSQWSDITCANMFNWVDRSR